MSLRYAQFLALLLASVAVSAMPLSEYLQSRGDPHKKTITDVYVWGVGKGIFWTEAENDVDGGQKLFCMPDKLALTSDLVSSLLDQEIDKPVNGRPYGQNAEIELILVNSFIGRFPCSH
jgi:hypothetical protein